MLVERSIEDILATAMPPSKPGPGPGGDEAEEAGGETEDDESNPT